MTVEHDTRHGRCKPLPEIVPQGGHTRGDGLHVAAGNLARLPESDDRCHVLRARPQTSLMACTQHEGGDRRAAPDVERPDPLRRVKLVAGDG